MGYRPLGWRPNPGPCPRPRTFAASGPVPNCESCPPPAVCKLCTTPGGLRPMPTICARNTAFQRFARSPAGPSRGPVWRSFPAAVGATGSRGPAPVLRATHIRPKVPLTTTGSSFADAPRPGPENNGQCRWSEQRDHTVKHKGRHPSCCPASPEPDGVVCRCFEARIGKQSGRASDAKRVHRVFPGGRVLAMHAEAWKREENAHFCRQGQGVDSRIAPVYDVAGDRSAVGPESSAVEIDR